MVTNNSVNDAIKDAEDARKEEDVRNKLESNFFHPRGREIRNNSSSEILTDEPSPQIIPELDESDNNNSNLHLKNKDDSQSIEPKSKLKDKFSLGSLKSLKISKKNTPRILMVGVVVIGAGFFLTHKSHRPTNNPVSMDSSIPAIKSQSWQSPSEEAYYNALSIQNHGLELQSHCSVDFMSTKTEDGKTRNACAVWSVDNTKPISLSVHWKSLTEENYYKSLAHMNDGLKLKEHCNSSAISDNNSSYKTCLIWVTSKGS